MSNITIQQKDSTTGKVTPQKSTAGSANSYLPNPLANERNIASTTNAYGVGVDESNYYVLDEGDGTAVAVSAGAPALLFGFYVNEVLAGATIILEDGAGNPVITIPAGGGAAVGTFIDCKGIKFNTAIVANAEASLTTGNITIMWRPQS